MCTFLILSIVRQAVLLLPLVLGPDLAVRVGQKLYKPRLYKSKFLCTFLILNIVLSGSSSAFSSSGVLPSGSEAVQAKGVEEQVLLHFLDPEHSVGGSSSALSSRSQSRNGYSSQVE